MADAAEVLRKWEAGGALWRVVSRTDAGVDVSLMTCTAGEEMDRFVSNDPALLAYIGDRQSSDE